MDTSPPDKIYLQVDPDSEDSWEGVTWCVDRINDTDIIYVRSNAWDEILDEVSKLEQRITALEQLLI